MISIYALINSITKCVFYVGATCNPDTRLKAHLSTRGNNEFKDYQISKALLLGGSIEMLILDTCERKDAKKEEEFYISLMQYYGFELNQSKISTYPLQSIFTKKDTEIVTHLSNGYKAKEIANICSIGVKAIEKRILQLKKRFNAKNVSHLVIIHFRKQLIE